ncbi:exodeoxyribonuclease I (plasmid) [Methylomarinum sp. Ch1-1]|uniref:Exodeoxyribonuclease I n=1 Tax=Methylomarinum roseum TaxID=3067653 RepID=A0AAU7P0D3_9GAMM|nr:exodeoxyribonuclease I [Methylomarinum sp. Ch1-1]MDP4523321.1 exodeoxyribonuclease I [Methylomarinum sp. Ch1-1]
MNSILWHDYETFGSNTRFDRPSQFAAIRTDLDLNIIGDPVSVYCKPNIDRLPSMEACLITGISPQLAKKEGLTEVEFFRGIHHEMMEPGTTSVGYNNLAFDDELSRHGFYRNFFDPYEREWRNGNSRWDFINVTRAFAAMRPEGINWPVDEEGRVTVKLDRLAPANGIQHLDAHDALADVRALIELARLFKNTNPKLYEYVWSLRNKSAVQNRLKLNQVVLHISPYYGKENYNAALIMPVARHPTNKNAVIAINMSEDVSALQGLDSESISQRVFNKKGDGRLPVMLIQTNKCPALFSAPALRGEDIDRLNLRSELAQLKAQQAIVQSLDLAVLRDAFLSDPTEVGDVDGMLYGGNFFDNEDRCTMNNLRDLSGADIAKESPVFNDPRLDELWFRFKARNHPESLTDQEQNRWREHCRNRAIKPLNDDLSIHQLIDKIDEHLVSASGKDHDVLSRLREYLFETAGQLDIDVAKQSVSQAVS